MSGRSGDLHLRCGETFSGGQRTVFCRNYEDFSEIFHPMSSLHFYNTLIINYLPKSLLRLGTSKTTQSQPRFYKPLIINEPRKERWIWGGKFTGRIRFSFLVLFQEGSSRPRHKCSAQKRGRSVFEPPSLQSCNSASPGKSRHLPASPEAANYEPG